VEKKTKKEGEKKMKNPFKIGKIFDITKNPFVDMWVPRGRGRF